MDATHETMKAMPVQAILPCKVCAFLETTQWPEYHRCTYQPPIGPTAFWQNPQPYKEPAQWRNTKYLEGNGPFTPGAKRVECEVYRSR